MTWKLLTNCEACKRFSFLIKKCVVQLPTGHKATLQRKLMCSKCIKKTQTALHGI